MIDVACVVPVDRCDLRCGARILYDRTAVAITGAPPCGAEVTATERRGDKDPWHLAEFGGLPVVAGTVP